LVGLLVQLKTSLDWFLNQYELIETGPVGSSLAFVEYLKCENQFWSQFPLKEGKNWDQTGLSSTRNRDEIINSISSTN